MIAIIDYKMGNLRSVEKALQIVGARTKVTSDPGDIKKAGKVVFPGVGSFGPAMAELKRLKLIAPIKDAIAEGKYFLGLCLGLQLLFDGSEEAPGISGLAVLAGSVPKFRPANKSLKVPHMGWNNIKIKKQKSKSKNFGQGILKGVTDDAYMYFVHSYYVKPKDKDVILTTTDYGIRFASGICKDNVYGFQFHPEKSQALGLKILKNFVAL